MKLSENNREMIYEEIQFVIGKMRESENMDESLYYLSAIHSVINRVFNLEFNQHLVFMHFILVNCYGIINKAVELSRQRKKPITIDMVFFKKLIDLLEILADTIKEDKSTFETLEKISVFVYSITGNGYYLQKKGVNVINF